MQRLKILGGFNVNRNEYQQTDEYRRFREIQTRNLHNLELLLRILLKDIKVVIFDPFSRSVLQGTTETIFSSADIQIRNGANFITNQMGLLDAAVENEYEIYIINDMDIPYIINSHPLYKTLDKTKDTLFNLWRTGALGSGYL